MHVFLIRRYQLYIIDGLYVSYRNSFGLYPEAQAYHVDTSTVKDSSVLHYVTPHTQALQYYSYV